MGEGRQLSPLGDGSPWSTRWGEDTSADDLLVLRVVGICPKPCCVRSTSRVRQCKEGKGWQRMMEELTDETE